MFTEYGAMKVSFIYRMFTVADDLLHPFKERQHPFSLPPSLPRHQFAVAPDVANTRSLTTSSCPRSLSLVRFGSVYFSISQLARSLARSTLPRRLLDEPSLRSRDQRLTLVSESRDAFLHLPLSRPGRIAVGAKLSPGRGVVAE